MQTGEYVIILGFLSFLSFLAFIALGSQAASFGKSASYVQVPSSLVLKQ